MRRDLVPVPSELGFSWRPQVMTDGQLAQWQRRQGKRVVSSRGRHWTHTRFNYWVPCDTLAALEAEELHWPVWSAAGYRAVVADPASATTTLRQGLVLDLPSFGAGRLTRDRRRSVRRALQSFEYRPLTTPQVLIEQGWQVASRAIRSKQHPLEKSHHQYRVRVRTAYEHGFPAVVGAFEGERLAGYMTSFAVAGTAYLERLYIDPGARSLEVGSGLYWVMLRMWAEVQGVQRAALGGTRAGLETIDAFKRSMGAQYFDLPAVGRARKPMAAAIKRARPQTYRQFV